MDDIFGKPISEFGPNLPTLKDIVCYHWYLDKSYRDQKVRFGDTLRNEILGKVGTALVDFFKNNFPSRKVNDWKYAMNIIRPLITKKLVQVKGNTRAFQRQEWRDAQKIHFSKTVNLLIDIDEDMESHENVPELSLDEVRFLHIQHFSLVPRIIASSHSIHHSFSKIVKKLPKST